MESNKEEKIKTVSEENIYKLNGLGARCGQQRPFRDDAYPLFNRLRSANIFFGISSPIIFPSFINIIRSASTTSSV